ncbi:Non-specific lipid-transfer protein [Rhynchospora pubera]|uniref:Non-specific lipid-transfer protein n=1 Tax=Rhynchospora pubera TaxID=906938 RepID=A0AAV8C9L2_9POAL|nr:Non-specific lipid-transfer protein [Rhynchospora pubera]
MARSLITLVLFFTAALSCTYTYTVFATPMPCNEVARMISPCASYLAGRSTMPYRLCCGGMTVLNRTAVTPSDKMTMCNCLKGVANHFPTVDFSRAALLPSLCGVSVNVTITPSMDCNSAFL